eukprot:3915383-Amphidinium_carterae.1
MGMGDSGGTLVSISLPFKSILSKCMLLMKASLEVAHPFFDWACAVVILVHSFVVGMLVNSHAGELSPLG